MLPHLKGVVGGEVRPDVGRERLRAAGEEKGSVRTHRSRGAAGVPSHLLFWQIFIYTSARGLKTVVERS